MKYKNTDTGVIIDTPCVISGKSWVKYDQKEVVEQTKPEEKPAEPVVEAEEKSETVPDDITKAQIMAELDAFGISYNKQAKKQVLYDLAMSSHGE